MKFIKVLYPFHSGAPDTPGVCYLISDNWDDFSYRTTFSVIIRDYDGGEYDLGYTRIITKGMKKGRVKVPEHFTELGGQYCSLGNDRDYYIKLSGIHSAIKNDFLDGIRDCVFNPAIWEEFKDEPAMITSLLRSVSERDVTFNFPRILAGNSELSPYKFSYTFQPTPESPEATCKFRVAPESLPPSNIHVLIGRNAVGKTRLLAGMADALTESKASSFGMPGRFNFTDDQYVSNTDFLNLVVVSYSAFDRFDPTYSKAARTRTGGIPYSYVGIKKIGKADEKAVLKTLTDFDKEFKDSLKVILADGSRMERWSKALETLESDPGIRELYLSNILTRTPDNLGNEIVRIFKTMSSGHKIVLLTMTKLVELVSDRTLILFDEPETHLHPPLLGSFIRSLSELLVARNGVAILATHSPVVLQEVPAKCVSVLVRSGNVIRVARPGIETFAENVSALTSKIFGLEVEESGFFKLLSSKAERCDFEQVLDEFDDQVGGEGRALVRALTSKKGSE